MLIGLTLHATRSDCSCGSSGGTYASANNLGYVSCLRAVILLSQPGSYLVTPGMRLLPTSF